MERRGDVVSLHSPDGVEVRHLRSFVAVADELSFRRAAQRLFLSQPALSRQIRTLERIVGCELLRRTTHRVELTLAGEALLDRARRVLEALDEAVAVAQSVGNEMTARIMGVWAPMMALSTTPMPVETMRELFENVLGHASMPPDVGVRPANAGGVPALVVGDAPEILYLHGGGHVLGSAYGYRPLVAALAVEARTGALVPDFRLAPEHPFPAALDDALTAYRWLLDQGHDPSSVVLAGDSSGAALVLAALLVLKTTGDPMPAGAVLLCPSVDLSGQMLTATETPHPMEEVLSVLADYLGGHAVDDPLVSPLHADLSGLPPLLVQCAIGDRTQPEAEQLVVLARRHGVATRIEHYDVNAHVFHIFWSFLPEARDALAHAGAFIDEVAERDRPNAATDAT